MCLHTAAAALWAPEQWLGRSGRLSPTVPPEVLSKAPPKHAKSPTLTHAGIAQSLAACPWLVELRLAGNAIGDAGATALAAALPRCALRGLRLSANRIGDAGGAALAAALLAPAVDGIPTPPPLLRRLELGYNRMRGAAAAELARALPRCALTYIDLEANRFSAAEEVKLPVEICILVQPLALVLPFISPSSPLFLPVTSTSPPLISP